MIRAGFVYIMNDQQSPQAPWCGGVMLYSRSIWQVIQSTSTMR